MITLEMGLPPQIFNVWNGSAWCVSHWLVWHSYMLLLIQQCFIERETPSVSARSGVGVRGGPPLRCIPWVCWGLSHLSFPGQRNLWGMPRGGCFSPSIMISSQFWAYHWMCSMDIWDCSSHSDLIGPQSDGSLWRKAVVVAIIPLK